MNVELLKDAIAIIDGIPDERIRLTRWQIPVEVASSLTAFPKLPNKRVFAYRAEEIHCGTIACAAGWLSLHPDMQARGLRVNSKADADAAYPVVDTGEKTLTGFAALAYFFDISDAEAETLFGARTSTEFLSPRTKHLSNKQLWLRRAKFLLHNPRAFKKLMREL